MSFGGPPPLFSFFFTLIPVLVVGIFVFVIGRGLFTWMKNNASDQVVTAAEIVSKRTLVSGGSGDTSAHTTYYVTFQFDNGNRVELRVRGTDYGLMAEGDQGQLAYQGTRFLYFNRVGTGL
ncbi:DUF2500 domain-containing protein [Paenibacillus allorhizosphaerae]|uniref:DUF2500 domain-containing protein n=1 Tax=Paenibacillus allorhizosphaerae TaxID=2849866 RepID=A0ABN7TQU3_9BACL|nr:DUF2500 domain-containing protein [Paenibacillus allorhizosphaerae]CAG7646972.1 hypothetical protein PAECIP111802_03878 [Paenibacillus allorhizosphaerae]